MNAKFRTFAAIACTAVCAMTLPACSLGKSTQLGKPKEATSLSYQETQDEGFIAFRDKVEEFSCRLAPSVYETYNKDGNFAVSPVSVYMALSLAAECSNGETRSEVLDALGVTHEQLRTYIPMLYRFLNTDPKSNSILKLGNSIWVNDGTPVNKDCIEALADYYFSYSYSADFAHDNAGANRAVRKFVKEQTKGLIDNDFRLSEETLFALINTLYLKTTWNIYGNDLPFAEGTYDFTQSDGSVNDIKLLQGYYNRGRVYESEKYSTFYTSTYSGYKLKFILPNEGYTVKDVFTAETVAEANAITDYNATDDVNKIRYYTRCLFPEYKADYNDDIKGVLQSKFGINLLFDMDKCDNSSLTDEPSYVTEVKHVTDLTVDKKGIEGAAVIVIPGAGAAGPDEYEEVYQDFTVNKSFGFIITDYQNNTLFSGVIHKV